MDVESPERGREEWREGKREGERLLREWVHTQQSSGSFHGYSWAGSVWRGSPDMVGMVEL